jgi:hypothetical protein
VVEESGDSACWSHRTCQQCGRLNDTKRPEVYEACGAPFPADKRGLLQVREHNG